MFIGLNFCNTQVLNFLFLTSKNLFYTGLFSLLNCIFGLYLSIWFFLYKMYRHKNWNVLLAYIIIMLQPFVTLHSNLPSYQNICVSLIMVYCLFISKQFEIYTVSNKIFFNSIFKERKLFFVCVFFNMFKKLMSESGVHFQIDCVYKGNIP